MPAAEFAHEAVKAMQRHGNSGIDSIGTELALIGLAGGGGSTVNGTCSSVDPDTGACTFTTADDALPGYPVVPFFLPTEGEEAFGLRTADGTAYNIFPNRQFTTVDIKGNDYTGIGYP